MNMGHQVWPQQPPTPDDPVKDGDLIELDTQFDHKVIAWHAQDGRRGGYHNDKSSGTGWQLLEEVAPGARFRIIDRPSSSQHAALIQQRAEEKRGTPYNLKNWNCESFVNYCYYGIPHSESVRVGVLWTTLGVSLGAVIVGNAMTPKRRGPRRRRS
jgi:hypothetical protein